MLRFDSALLAGLLNAGVTHYAIPDVLSLSNYLEVFEQPGITGCILLQTVLTHVCFHVLICVHVYTSMCSCMYVSMYSHVSICLHVYISMCSCMYVSMYSHVSICLHVYISMCSCTYAHICPYAHMFTFLYAHTCPCGRTCPYIYISRVLTLCLCAHTIVFSLGLHVLHILTHS